MNQKQTCPLISAEEPLLLHLQAEEALVSGEGLHQRHPQRHPQEEAFPLAAALLQLQRLAEILPLVLLLEETRDLPPQLRHQLPLEDLVLEDRLQLLVLLQEGVEVVVLVLVEAQVVHLLHQLLLLLFLQEAAVVVILALVVKHRLQRHLPLRLHLGAFPLAALLQLQLLEPTRIHQLPHLRFPLVVHPHRHLLLMMLARRVTRDQLPLRLTVASPLGVLQLLLLLLLQLMLPKKTRPPLQPLALVGQQLQWQLLPPLRMVVFPLGMLLPQRRLLPLPLPHSPTRPRVPRLPLREPPHR